MTIEQTTCLKNIKINNIENIKYDFKKGFMYNYILMFFCFVFKLSNNMK